MALPYSEIAEVFKAAAADAVGSIPTSLSGAAAVVQIEVATAGYTGTYDIQGRVHQQGTWVNLPYVVQATGMLEPAVAQVSETTDTGTVIYIVIAPMPFMRINMARSAGAITAYARGFSSAFNLGLAAAAA